MSLDYTIWFNDDAPGLDYRWSLATDEAIERTNYAGMPEMFAPLIKGGIRNTFTLLKKDHPEVSEPVQVREPVKILGRNGQPDLLKNILTRPVYENRTITETFVLLGQNAESGGYYVGSDREWAAMVSELVNYFNSFKSSFRIVLSHDKGFYWKGTITAKAEQERYRAIVTITADVEPYKYERYSSAEPWIWDDFSFIDGIIRDYGVIDLTEGSAELSIPVRIGDIKPGFRFEDDTIPTAFSNLISAIGAFGEQIGYGEIIAVFDSEYWGDVSDAWKAVTDAYDTIQSNYYGIPEYADQQSKIGNMVAVLGEDIEASPQIDSAIMYDLREITAAIPKLSSSVTAGQVMASTDGVIYYAVGSAEYTTNDNVILRGAGETDLNLAAGRQTTINRKLYLSGVRSVSLDIRGATL